MKNDAVYLAYMVQCIDRIEEYARDGKGRFFADHRTHNAAIHLLQTMTESSTRLSRQRREAYPEVPWKEIAGFRNVLVHDYLGVRLERVWEIIERDLPPFAHALRAMIREMGGGDEP